MLLNTLDYKGWAWPSGLSAMALMLVLAGPAQAAPDGEAAVTAEATEGNATPATKGRVTSYDSAYFTQFAPTNALDMVRRVPGFAIEDGGGEVRGFSSAAGNVVLNGARPSSKSESLGDILARIPARRVVRIEVGPGDLYGSDYAGKSQVLNVVLRRDEVRQLVLSSEIPEPIYATYDLRLDGPWQLIRDAIRQILDPQNRVIRVIGNPVQEAGLLIEITTETAPLRSALLEYGGRILILSALISAVTALLLFLAVRRLLVMPIRRVVNHMTAYADAPEDARRVIDPTAGVVELRVAEEALQSMQTQLTSALRQKERLAQLGSAVAKIAHDLRNIFSVTAGVREYAM